MNPKQIVVHCAATPEGGWYTVTDIDRWHRERGWNGIGYHKVILLDGAIEFGRPEGMQGVHVASGNKDTLSVCYIGGVTSGGRVPKDTRTDVQRMALIRVVQDWMSQYDIPVTQVLGHYELDARKACPSFDMGEFRANLVAEKPPEEFVPVTLSPENFPVIGGHAPIPLIRILQRRLGVPDDGWIGPETYRAIAKLVNSIEE